MKGSKGVSNAFGIQNKLICQVKFHFAAAAVVVERVFQHAEFFIDRFFEWDIWGFINASHWYRFISLNRLRVCSINVVTLSFNWKIYFYPLLKWLWPKMCISSVSNVNLLRAVMRPLMTFSGAFNTVVFTSRTIHIPRLLYNPNNRIPLPISILRSLFFLLTVAATKPLQRKTIAFEGRLMGWWFSRVKSEQNTPPK